MICDDWSPTVVIVWHISRVLSIRVGSTVYAHQLKLCRASSLGLFRRDLQEVFGTFGKCHLLLVSALREGVRIGSSSFPWRLEMLAGGMPRQFVLGELNTGGWLVECPAKDRRSGDDKTVISGGL
jgi:hypothetical protein